MSDALWIVVEKSASIGDFGHSKTCHKKVANMEQIVIKYRYMENPWKIHGKYIEYRNVYVYVYI
jgi:hypothetical protein